MEQNIGIAYGAVIENAIGGHGDDRINGNQADNMFTGGEGADTFIIADYSGTIPDPSNAAGKVVVDNSIDTITDFMTGEDKIDLTSFGHLTAADVSYTDGDLHFSANGQDYALHLLGAAIDVNNDIIFG
jgi:Ca2+-binding RTX toxin-like protein